MKPETKEKWKSIGKVAYFILANVLIPAALPMIAKKINKL